MAPQEPLVGAALIARFMAGVAHVRRAFGAFEIRPVTVNGQPGRLVRGPAERPYTETDRRAAEKALALLKSGEIDAHSVAALATTRVDTQREGEVRVWQVLTVDVVDGRIQTVRIVRNPDKLAHL
jgi:RNA polymerase sigma-70 factor, ECF subfamily